MSSTFVVTPMHCRDQRVRPCPRLAAVSALADGSPAVSVARWLDTARELVSHFSSAGPAALLRRASFHAQR